MIISIDIGTSYSSACMLGPDGKAQPVDISTGASMFGGKYSLPTAVFVEENGNVLIGQAAMNRRKSNPRNFLNEFKRNFGEEEPMLLGPRSFKPEELYAELFRHMKSCAEKARGEQVELAYLTCPASYGEKRREKLRCAAKAAGLFQVELVDEPTAAAMCYQAEGYIQDGQTLLLYDFGGGTFDVSLLEYKDGIFRLLAEPDGLERCGGADMDQLIRENMMEAIGAETLGELSKNQMHYLRFASQLAEMAVKAKHHLSAAEVFEEDIPIGFDMVSYSLTVEAFNKKIAPLVGDTIKVCRRALEDAGISVSGLSAVLLSGGTSRVPLVREMVKRSFPEAALLCAVDLELAVAQGALAYRAFAAAKQGIVQTGQNKERSAAGHTEQGQGRFTAYTWNNTKPQAAGTGRMSKQEGKTVAKECFWKGIEAEERKDYGTALNWYQTAAGLGDKDAFERLQALNKTSKSPELAAEYYNKGCSAQMRGAWQEAVQWYRRAADLRHAGALYSLGWCYEHGKGVSRPDQGQANMWYQKAAESGNADAVKRMKTAGNPIAAKRVMAAEEHTAILFYNQGCEAERRGAWQEATALFRRAADLRYPAAMFQLGWCYANGKGVRRADYGQAVMWYQKAADLGDKDAMCNLGVCYANGQGVKQDYAKANQWYRKAIELGQMNAMNNLGVNYQYGQGVSKDIKQAAAWYRKAAQLGNETATENLRRL